jgi:small subunit ribosomal protein S21
MATVINDGRMDFEQMLKIFKRKVTNEGVVREFKEHEFFEKPSHKKHRETQELKKRIKKLNKKRDFHDWD